MNIKEIIKNRKKSILIVALVVLAFCAIVFAEDGTEDETTDLSENTTNVTSTKEAKVSDEPKATSKPQETEKPKEKSTDKDSLAKYDITFAGDVRNDKTGKWKLSRTATSEEVTKYAAEYYNTYFESNDEIHAIVNFTTKTTNKISLISDDTLDVCIFEYVDGEEHDASKLFGGMLLGEYHITISNGNVDKIQ